MKKFNILVVDDEQEFREMTVKQLLHRGMEAEGAEDGKIGLEMVEEGNFDVVLLDVKMPVMDGIKALRKMKQAKPLVEVVLLTGHASVDSGIEGMKLGAFDYLMKPMEFDEVLEKLCDAFEKRRIHLDKIEMAQMKKHMSLPS
ncbi:response regulator [Desulforhopalus vacuolatus]|nr:response regulator [Desulforhopalus vacuolatus]